MSLSSSCRCWPGRSLVWAADSCCACLVEDVGHGLIIYLEVIIEMVASDFDESNDTV